MKQQLITLLKQLPDPIAEMAIKNLNIRDLPNDNRDYTHIIKDVAWALRVSFTWFETSQGFSFWYDIHNNLQKKIPLEMNIDNINNNKNENSKVITGNEVVKLAVKWVISKNGVGFLKSLYNNMQKPILIIGPMSSGKTTKSKEIASHFQKNEVVFISGRRKNMFQDDLLFSECTLETKLIVFDDIYQVEQVEQFLNIAYEPIVVNKAGNLVFILRPQFVLVCTANITHEQLVESFYSSFEIIEQRNN